MATDDRRGGAGAGRAGSRAGPSPAAARRTAAVLALAWGALTWAHPAAARQDTGDTDAPGTEVVVLDLSVHLDHVHVGSLMRVATPGATSRDPHFTDHDRVLFLTADEDGDEQLREHTLSTGEERVLVAGRAQLSHPRADPSGAQIALLQRDGHGSSYVVVYPAEGGPPVRVLPGVDDVVAFAWADQHRIFLVRGEGPRVLDLADLRTGVQRLREHVGPVIASIPGSLDVSFVDERDPDAPTLSRWRTERGDDERIAPLPGRESTHAWFSPYTALLLHEGVLYRSTGDPDRPWHPMLTELDELLGRASDFAVSTEALRIAVVIGSRRR